MPLGQLLFKARSYTPIPFLIIILFFAAPTPFSLTLGYALMLLGEALRIWSVGYTGFTTRTRNVGAAQLVTSGPYAYTRNPIYLGNFILSLGVCTAFNALMPWTLLVFTALFTFQYHFIIRLEEETLAGKFGEAYQAFLAGVPRFLPSLRRFAGASSHSFQLAVGLRNEKNTFASILFIVLCSLAYFLFNNPLLSWIHS
ncbi:MAG: hypothetical protein A2293_02970 [Elusimicrobia bacterium RIFOXYB2_FULL_49_7]|nr:MAG: hypothetical protein A2293_02970 [Elusimicrobia bacterium RIFOXYB2_FULL_49_7]